MPCVPGSQPRNPQFLSGRPAYAKTYSSGKALIADWNAGVDFQVCSYTRDWTYININDIPDNVVINVRYNDHPGHRGQDQIYVIFKRASG